MRRKQDEADRAVVDCHDPDWQKELHSRLYSGADVDLVNFEYELHGESCELIAQAFGTEFQLHRVALTKAAHFRRKSEWTSPSEGDRGKH